MSDTDAVIVHIGKRNVVTVDLHKDVSSDTVTSQIRTQPTTNAPLIAEWDVNFLTDGTDGKLVLSIEYLVSSQIKAKTGFMDIKIVVNDHPMPLFDKPLPVVFRDGVTA